MEEKETKPLTPPLQDLGECKVVWKEEEKTKVGRGKITNDDVNFVIVNKKDIIAIKAAAQEE